MKKIVIIGGVAAGAKAAAKSRRMDKDAEINLYTEDANVSYSACGLPYYIAGIFEDYQKLLVRSPEEFEKSGIHIHLRNRVEKIIPEKKQILVVNLDTLEEFYVNYDKLVIATGASPVIPDIKNVHLKNVFTLRTLEDGVAIRNQARKSNHVTIVGGGYIGIELLEAFVKNNLQVTLVEFAPHIMPILDEDIATLIEKHIRQKDGEKVKLVTSDAVVELIGKNSVEKVKTKNGLEFKTDMVVLSVGVRPNVKIAKDAGIELGITRAIKVNQKMQTNLEDIYACGDCAEKTQIVSKTPTWIPLGSTANKEGRCAAININGEEDLFQGVLGSAVTRYFGLTISTTGLSEKEATKLGSEVVSATVTKYDKAGYMPEAKNLTVKLIADKNTKKLLGAQAIGCGDADKRINTVTTALLAGMTVKDFCNNDMTYAPPFSTPIDTVLNACEALLKKL